MAIVTSVAEAAQKLSIWLGQVQDYQPNQKPLEELSAIFMRVIGMHEAEDMREAEYVDPEFALKFSQTLRVISPRVTLLEIAEQVSCFEERGIASTKEKEACERLIEKLISVSDSAGEWGAFQAELTDRLLKVHESYQVVESETAQEPDQALDQALCQPAESASPQGQSFAEADSPKNQLDVSTLQDALKSMSENPSAFSKVASPEKASGIVQGIVAQFREANNLYQSEKYTEACAALEGVEVSEAFCLVGRAYTKLKKFDQAKEAFDCALGEKFSLSNEDRHFILHRRANMWLEWFKVTGNKSYLEGCFANLNLAFNFGASYHAAYIGWELMQYPCPWSGISTVARICASIFLEHGKPSSIWNSIAVLLNRGKDDVVRTLLFSYPTPSCRAILKLINDGCLGLALQQLDKSDDLSVEEPLLLALIVMKEAKSREFSAIEWRPDHYKKMHQYGSAFLKRGVVTLARAYLERAWRGCFSGEYSEGAAVTLLYASVLAQQGDWGKLQGWLSRSISFKSFGGIPFHTFVLGFLHHHQIGQADTMDTPSLEFEPRLITEKSVRRELNQGKLHHEMACEDPYWEAIILHYFPKTS